MTRNILIASLSLALAYFAFLAFIVLFQPTNTANRNSASRRSEVAGLLSAINLYKEDRHGNIPPGIPTDASREICALDVKGCKGYVDLSILLRYMPEGAGRWVKDPLVAAPPYKGTGFFIMHNPTSRTITISAPLEANDTTLHDPQPVISTYSY